jgi:pyruvate formate lyase activating enzyme
MISGKRMSLEEVIEVVKKDSLFYSNSGGGVTASGGEPASQPDFLLQLFRECRDCGINTTLDTCGYATWEILQPILEYTDLVLYDVKHMDPVRHKELTGVDNELILENAVKIARAGKPMIIRVPLIPHHNDSLENIKALGDFVSNKLRLSMVDILPYHPLGENKYLRLGMKYKPAGIKQFDHTQLETIRKIFESYHLEVRMG